MSVVPACVIFVSSGILGTVLTSADVKQRARELGFDVCGIAPATALPELAALATTGSPAAMPARWSYLHKSADDPRRHPPLPARRALGHRDRAPSTTPSAAPAPEPGARAGDRARRPLRARRGLSPRARRAARALLVAGCGREHRRAVRGRGVRRQAPGAGARLRRATPASAGSARTPASSTPRSGRGCCSPGVATSLPLEPDAPGVDQCGACTLCLDACPTGALVDAHELDATRCISYLTIELAGAGARRAQRAAVGDHLFGCDICQDVCPWNLAPPVTADAAWQPRAGRDGAAPPSCGSAPIRSCTGSCAAAR